MSLKQFLFYLPPRENQILYFEKIQLQVYYVLTLLMLFIFPLDAVKVYKEGARLLGTMAVFNTMLTLFSLYVFFKTRRLDLAQRFVGLIVFISLNGTIITAGGPYGMSALYVLCLFSIIYVVLDHISGIALPVYFLAALSVRFQIGGFHPRSIYNDPVVRDRILLVITLSCIFAVTSNLIIQKLLKHLSRLAFTDEVTEMPNATKFYESYRNIALNNVREGGSVTLLGIRILQMDQININLGSDAGDKVLREVAERLKKARFLLTSRWSGSAFMVLFQTSDPDELQTKAQKILNDLLRPYLQDKGINLSFNMSVSRFPEDGDAPKYVLRNVLTLLQDRQLSPNEIAYFNLEKLRREQRRFHLTDALNNSDWDREFNLAYLPKINMKTLQCEGVEILLRWTRQDKGSVSPLEFIPIAEETGKIKKISRWVIERSFLEISRHIDRSRTKALLFSINVSVHDLKDPDFLPFLQDRMAKYGIEPYELELEVTERVQADQDSTILRSLTELADRGVKLAIDDFGTGYSSLSYLHQLHVHTLKIDKSFVDKISFPLEKDYPVLDAIISMALSMGLEVTAEGIEEEQQFLYLKNKGCHFAQGWYFSPPLSVDDFFIFSKM